MTSTTPEAPAGVDPLASSTLRGLYLARFGFALVWAAAFAVAASAADGPDLGVGVAALLVLYPLVDVAAAVVDLSRTRAPELALNIVVSAATVVGLGIAAASGPPASLRVWGAWAIVAGLVQLVVALRRRALGGQVPMILSGGISVLAGASFVASAGGDDPSVTSLAGYAVLGGVFFLVSALRLHAAARTS